MGGASAAQDQLSEEETAAYQQSQQMTAEQYAAQKEIYAPMAAQFQSIFAQGPNQEGFSAPELNNLNAEAVEGTATNYGQAARAVNEQLAGEGGGTNPLPTGGQTQLREEVAESAAGQESSEESNIQQADYAAGKSNWQTAAEGLSGIATGENPLGYENAEASSAGVANTEANAIEDANNSWINATIGAVGNIAGDALGGYLSGK